MRAAVGVWVVCMGGPITEGNESMVVLRSKLRCGGLDRWVVLLGDFLLQ